MHEIIMSGFNYFHCHSLMPTYTIILSISNIRGLKLSLQDVNIE